MLLEEEIIEYVYVQIKDLLLSGIELEEYKQIIELEYKKRIQNRIDKNLLKSKEIKDNKIKWFSLLCKQTDFLLLSQSPEQKINYFIFSPQLNQLNQSSNIAFYLAINFMNTNKVSPLYNEFYRQIVDLFNNKKVFFIHNKTFKNQFKYLFSETMLDLQFASGEIKFSSIRIGKLLDEKEKMRDFLNGLS